MPVRRPFVLARPIAALALAILALVAAGPGTDKPDTNDAEVGRGSSLPPGGPETPPADELRRGGLAPDFELPTVDGRSVRLSDLRGKKPVLLIFWASWCAYSRSEMPRVDRVVYRRYRERGLEVIAVSLDRDTRAATDFAQTRNLGYPVLLDPTRAVAHRYRINGVPSHVYINKAGLVRTWDFGVQSWLRGDAMTRIEAMLD